MKDLNIQYVVIKRAIIHTIHERTPPELTARAELEKDLVELDERTKILLINRIQSALSKDSKSFELKIENTTDDSFFGYVSAMNSLNDELFIDKSQEVALLLAESQKRIQIPGGFLIIIDAYNDITKKSVYIVIKAEQQDVLKFSGGKLEVLEKVFLSEAQKLYKIGLIYEIETSSADNIDVNNYKGILFDSQFSDDTPAEYFYKDFLGFSISENDKIQTALFYNDTIKFLKENLKGDYEEMDRTLRLFKSLMLDSMMSLINPSSISTQLFNDVAMLNKYYSKVVSTFPPSFTRNPIMISQKLSNRKMEFSKNKIKVLGPEDNFNESVKVITSEEDLKQLDITDSTYTILKINGKPS